MEPLGLYIHIPFCKSKCAYCDFYSLPGCTEARMDGYTAALRTHLRTFAACLRDRKDSGGYLVDTVYFGGGTPSLLGWRRLLDIWETVVREYPAAADAEVTMEANPDSCGGWLSSLRAAGFNRISLGMQSADDGELREIGRVHTSAQTRAAVETARRAGFENLSLDLIYGLPRQTMAQWQENVRAALDLAPEHLSCYGLKVEPGTPLYRRRAAAALPGEEEQADFYLWAVEELGRAGFRQYEISNFSRPGRASRHNLKYWTLSPYIGFGPGAHSDFDGARYAWGRDLDGYIQAAGVTQETGGGRAAGGIRAAGDSRTFCSGQKPFPFAEYEEISPAERAREWVMLGLRTAAGLDPGEYVRRFGGEGGRNAGTPHQDAGTPHQDAGIPYRGGIPAFERFLPFLDQCRRAGYAVREAGRWRLTPQGFLVSNQIIGRLLELWEP